MHDETRLQVEPGLEMGPAWNFALQPGSLAAWTCYNGRAAWTDGEATDGRATYDDLAQQRLAGLETLYVLYSLYCTRALRTCTWRHGGREGVAQRSGATRVEL